MEVAAGETIGPDYVAMLANDMGYEAKSAVASKAPTPSSRVRVAVVGAGMSGLLAGIQLQRAGIEYTIFERNPEVGGTWYESVYPGCGVDTPNHFYNYSFFANKNWTRYFAKGPEIQKYFVDTANEFVLRGKIRFSTRVTRAAFDESRRLWTLSLVGPDGKSETHEAEVVIFAVGLFGNAVIPDIPEIKAFAGRVIHTSRWPKGESIAGKHVVRRAGSRATATPRISSARVRSSNFSASS